MAEETKAKGRPRGRGRRARTRGLYKRGGGREGQLTSSGGSGLSGPPYPPSVVGGPSSTPFSILEGEAPPEKWPKEREKRLGLSVGERGSNDDDCATLSATFAFFSSPCGSVAAEAERKGEKEEEKKRSNSRLPPPPFPLALALIGNPPFFRATRQQKREND